MCDYAEPIAPDRIYARPNAVTEIAKLLQTWRYAGYLALEAAS